MEKVILHCDLNNFYASVEIKNHPEYTGMAVAVAGNPEKRHGIVLAKSQLAKSFGVATGDTLWQARQKCPDIVFLEPNFLEYVKYSNIVFEIYKRYTDRVESFGMDECWLDVSSTVGILGNGEHIANELREAVKRETGLTISVGVSFTKVFAKLGSDMKKPDATTVISKENFREKIWGLPCGDMLMIGRRTAKKLSEFGIYTLGELANTDKASLRPVFGVLADQMVDNANGIENDSVRSVFDNSPRPKSVGNGTTTAQDMKCYEDAKTVIFALAENVATRLRKYMLEANGVALSLRYATLDGISRQSKLTYATSNATDIAAKACEMLKTMHDFSTPLRALTVTAIRLTDVNEGQATLFDEEKQKESKIECAVDKVRAKYGYHAVKRAIVLDSEFLDRANLHEDDDFQPFKR